MPEQCPACGKEHRVPFDRLTDHVIDEHFSWEEWDDSDEDGSYRFATARCWCGMEFIGRLRDGDVEAAVFRDAKRHLRGVDLRAHYLAACLGVKGA